MSNLFLCALRCLNSPCSLPTYPSHTITVLCLLLNPSPLSLLKWREDEITILCLRIPPTPEEGGEDRSPIPSTPSYSRGGRRRKRRGMVCEGYGGREHGECENRSEWRRILIEIVAQCLYQSWACTCSIPCYNVMLPQSVSSNEIIIRNRNDFSIIVDYIKWLVSWFHILFIPVSFIKGCHVKLRNTYSSNNWINPLFSVLFPVTALPRHSHTPLKGPDRSNL